MKRKVIMKVAALACVMAMALSACGSKEDSGATASLTPTNAPGADSGTDTGDDTSGDNGDDDGGVQEELPSDAEVVVDLNGYEFSIVDFAQGRWQPDPGTPRDDRILELIEDVENTFNCTITYQDIGPSLIFETIQPAAFANDKYADLITTTMWAYGRLLGSNIMGDLSSIETLDLSNPWWNQNVIEACTINGKVLAAAGSFMPHTANAWVMYFNKKIWAELNYEDPYELVRTGEWTYEKMYEFARGAARDLDGNSVIDTDSDRWGLVTPRGDYARAMYLGMGGRYYAADASGQLKTAFANSEAYGIIDFMRQFTQTPGVVWYTGNDSIENAVIMFQEDKALFLSYMAGYGTLKGMESDFGILPIPKGTPSQASYVGCVDHNAPIFGVTEVNKDTYEVGIILEALGRRFVEVERMMLEDWEDTLWRSDEDIEMVDDYIHGHGGYDIALIIQNANSTIGSPMGQIWSNVFAGGSTDIASDFEAAKDAIQYQLDEFFGVVQ